MQTFQTILLIYLSIIPISMIISYIFIGIAMKRVKNFNPSTITFIIYGFLWPIYWIIFIKNYLRERRNQLMVIMIEEISYSIFGALETWKQQLKDEILDEIKDEAKADPDMVNERRERREEEMRKMIDLIRGAGNNSQEQDQKK